jgi:hypothetical protein
VGRLTRRRASTGIRYAAVGLLLVGGVVGCGGGNSSTSTELDPVTTVAVSGESLKVVSSKLCDVTGTIRNLTDDRRLDVMLHYQAFDEAGNFVGQTGVGIADLAPGETRSFDATAFVTGSGATPCDRISHFERDQTSVVD